MSAEQQIPDIILERYRLHELPEPEASRVRDLIAHHPPLRERLDALDRSDAEMRASGLMDALDAGVRQRIGPGDVAPGARRWGRGLVTVTAIAAIATIAIAVVPRGVGRPTVVDSRGAQGTDDDRIKGLRPALAVYRRTADGSETLADGAVTRPGDLLRIGYRAAGRAYGVILSVDGRGSVTLHLPSGASRAAALRREATVLLDQAYELDDAPRWERFYFVTGDEPFAVAPILDAARRIATNDLGSHAAALPLPPGLEQSSFSIQKETTP